MFEQNHASYNFIHSSFIHSFLIKLNTFGRAILPCESNNNNNNIQNNIQYHTTHIHKTVTTYTYTIITKQLQQHYAITKTNHTISNYKEKMKSHVQQQWAQEVHSTILHSDNEKMTVSVRDDTSQCLQM